MSQSSSESPPTGSNFPFSAEEALQFMVRAQVQKDEEATLGTPPKNHQP